MLKRCFKILSTPFVLPHRTAFSICENIRTKCCRYFSKRLHAQRFSKTPRNHGNLGRHRRQTVKFDRSARNLVPRAFPFDISKGKALGTRLARARNISRDYLLTSGITSFKEVVKLFLPTRYPTNVWLSFSSFSSFFSRP